MSIKSPEIDGKAIVAVGILALFVVAGVAGTSTAESPSTGIKIHQTPGEVDIVVVTPGNADSMSLGAPNGNRSVEIGDPHSGMRFTVVETPENRTVPVENYLATGATKTEVQTCWISHGGVELGDDIRVNQSVDIPCDGGEIAGPQNLDSVGESDEAVLIELGDEIEYQDGTYGVLYEVGGEEKLAQTFTVGSGGPSYLHEGPPTGNSLYSIIGITAAVASVFITVLLIEAVLWESSKDE